MFPVFLTFYLHIERGKCCPFISENFLAHRLSIFGSAGKMLPIFSKDFFLHIASWHFGSKQGKMLLNFLEMFLAHRLHIIWFKTGENAAHFSPRYFLAHRLHIIWFKIRGKCCPYFSHLHIKTGGNAAHFSQRLFLHIDLACLAQQGKCCPFFSKDFSCTSLRIFVQNRGKCCLILSKKMFLHIDFTLSRSKQGKMLPIFLQEFFLHMDLAFGP